MAGAGLPCCAPAGTLQAPAGVVIGGDVIMSALGAGGAGGSSDGSDFPAGRGGDGFGGSNGIVNQADEGFDGGIYLLAGADNAGLSLGGTATLNASGTGGAGGDGAGQREAADGGDGVGGFAEVGVALLGTNGLLGQGGASFQDLNVNVEGVGGIGGRLDTFLNGNGGAGNGGIALMQVQRGELTAGSVAFQASGVGGNGFIGGSATGGTARLDGLVAGGSATLDNLVLRAGAFGGDSDTQTGAGQGGLAAISLNGVDLTVAGNLELRAFGVGRDSFGGLAGAGSGGVSTIDVRGDSTFAVGGDATLDVVAITGVSNISDTAAPATAGEATIVVDGASVFSIAGSLTFQADAEGSDNLDGSFGAGGDAQGGTARAIMTNGGTLSVGNQFRAIVDGRGGDGVGGGFGRGGVAEIAANGGTLEALSGATLLTATGSGGFGEDGGTGGLGSGRHDQCRSDRGRRGAAAFGQPAGHRRCWRQHNGAVRRRAGRQCRTRRARCQFGAGCERWHDGAHQRARQRPHWRRGAG
jgi:hypothetical protein